MDSFLTDEITPALDRMLIRGPHLASDAVRRVASVAASDFAKAIPLAEHVQFNDQIDGYVQQTKPVLVSPTSEGIEVKIRPFFAKAYDFRIKQAVGLGGDTAKLNHEGLWIRKKLAIGEAKDGAPRTFIEFEGAVRLRDWAEEHNMIRRRAVLINGRAEIAVLWSPFRAALVLDIQKEISLSFKQRGAV